MLFLFSFKYIREKVNVMLKKICYIFVLLSFFYPVFAADLTEHEIYYTYSGTTDVWTANVGTDIANNPLFIWNRCYDLDKFINKMRNGDTGFNASSFNISCTDADADIKCNNNGLISAGGSYSRLSRIGSTDISGAADCTYRDWNASDTIGATGSRCGFTTNGTYYIEYSESGGGYACSKGKIYIKNVTYSPYIQSNFTTDTGQSSTIDLIMNPLGGMDKVYMYLTDLGFSTSVLSSAEWVYYYDNFWNGQTSQLGLSGGSSLGYHAFYNYETTTGNTALGVPCSGLTNFQLNNYAGVNVPTGTYDLYCRNITTRPYYGFVYAAIKFINVTDNRFSAFLVRTTKDYLSITNVFNVPLNPSPNMTVSIRWTTSIQANSSLYWRTKPLGNWTDGFSSWTVSGVNDFVYSHTLTINGTDIIDGYQYEYYVSSGEA